MHLICAPGERHRHHGCPGRDFLPGPWPVAGDLADELVAKHHLLTGAHEAVVADLRQHVGLRVRVVTDMQVGPADAAAKDVDDDLAGAGLRVRQVDELQLGVLAGDRLHRATSLMRAGGWRRRAAAA